MLNLDIVYLKNSLIPAVLLVRSENLDSEIKDLLAKGLSCGYSVTLTRPEARFSRLLAT
jgi:hypothetical protein